MPSSNTLTPRIKANLEAEKQKTHEFIQQLRSKGKQVLNPAYQTGADILKPKGTGSTAAIDKEIAGWLHPTIR